MKMKLIGVEQAIKNLKTLEKNIQRKFVRKAVREGAKPIVKAAQAASPYRSGRLRRSIRVASTKFDGRVGSLSAFVSSKGTKAQQRAGARSIFYSRRTRSGNQRFGAAFYHHMVVRGTKPHTIKGPSLIGGNWRSNIRHPGARPNNFYARAATLAFASAIREFGKRLGKDTENAARRLPK